MKVPFRGFRGKTEQNKLEELPLDEVFSASCTRSLIQLIEYRGLRTKRLMMLMVGANSNHGRCRSAAVSVVELFAPANTDIPIGISKCHCQRSRQACICIDGLVFFRKNIILAIKHPAFNSPHSIIPKMVVNTKGQANCLKRVYCCRPGVGYVVVSSVTILLINFYSRSIFSEKKYAMVAGSLLLVLFGFIYIILQLEDYALLAGSIALFVIIALIMYLTRKIRW